MERDLATLEKGVRCCSWNYCGQRLAVGYADGSVAVHDSADPSSTFSRSSKWMVHACGIMNIVWIPPEFGDAIACLCVDGTLSLWEEVGEDVHSVSWKQCKVFECSDPRVLEVQFGVSSAYLKLVAAYSDGRVKVYELLDALDLNKWQLQISPIQFSQDLVFAFFDTKFKIWEFEEARQRWLPVAELALTEDKDDRVHAVAWAPNIGRSYELVAVASCKGIAIWHVGLNSEPDERLPAEKVALLSGHDGEIWQLDWDMSGMTLASTGGDGMIRLWQSNLNGIWHEEAVLDCCGGQ
ncbi:hypothetical protein HPP92_004231 [Vanilla planifolia]|uniref:Protein SEH1 n=1 Tax=Vanilla planifolia TaxID=51239 RepID=A0A835VC38_VANPL|nr:hypothetical protein HPP92_004677 [Vanilla planifolia]KAG0493237.1 hypothetical protein HPP92_004231 [Vanilla planifolia]